MELLELWTVLGLVRSRTAIGNEVSFQNLFKISKNISFQKPLSQMASTGRRIMCGFNSCNETVQQPTLPSWYCQTIIVQTKQPPLVLNVSPTGCEWGPWSAWACSVTCGQVLTSYFSKLCCVWFSRRFPCQGRQYRTRAVSASYHGPDCLGPSYFVGGVCPNIEVASFVICSFLFLKNQSAQPCPTEKPGPRTLEPTGRTAPTVPSTDTPGIFVIVMFCLQSGELHFYWQLQRQRHQSQ